MLPVLPKALDNQYRGHNVALWLFGFLTFIKSAQSLNSFFNPYLVASTADGIPLGTYPTTAANVVVSLFALLGVTTFMICLVSIAALVRYRTMVPLLFLVFLMQYAIGRLILLAHPIARSGPYPGLYINLGLLALMLAGLALSLLSPKLKSRSGGDGE